MFGFSDLEVTPGQPVSSHTWNNCDIVVCQTWLVVSDASVPPTVYSVTQRLLPEEPRSRRLMTSDQDTKVVAEPQVQQVQEAKESAHLVSWHQTVFFTLTKAWKQHVSNFSCQFQELWVIVSEK